MAITVLKWSEDMFWCSTPRKLTDIIHEHAKFEGWTKAESKEKDIYIDECSWL